MQLKQLDTLKRYETTDNMRAIKTNSGETSRRLMEYSSYSNWKEKRKKEKIQKTFYQKRDRMDI